MLGKVANTCQELSGGGEIMRALSPQFSHAPSLLRVNKNQARGEDLGTYLAPLTLALTFVQPEHILHVAQRNSWQKRTVF